MNDREHEVYVLRQVEPVPRSKHSEDFLCDDNGLSTVEYIIILVLIAVLAIGVWRSFGDSVQVQVNDSTNSINRYL